MIINKWLNFKNKIESVGNVGNIVFSYDDNGLVWHEIEEHNEGVYIMTKDGRVVMIEQDKTMISPIEKTNIYLLDDCKLGIGDFVVNKDGDIAKIDVSEYLYPTVDVESGKIAETNDMEYVKNRKKNAIIDMKRLISEIKSLEEDYVDEFKDEINEMKEELKSKQLVIDKCNKILGVVK